MFKRYGRTSPLAFPSISSPRLGTASFMNPSPNQNLRFKQNLSRVSPSCSRFVSLTPEISKFIPLCLGRFVGQQNVMIELEHEPQSISSELGICTHRSHAAESQKDNTKTSMRRWLPQDTESASAPGHRSCSDQTFRSRIRSLGSASACTRRCDLPTKASTRPKRSRTRHWRGTITPSRKTQKVGAMPWSA